jgi:CheY-like chemotaxis protein
MRSVDPKSRGAVLVVDDDADLRTLLREALEYVRYDVLEADDGKGALDILRLDDTPPVRVIVLDLLMPGMSGWELIEMLHRDPKLSQIPVLVMSAVSVHGDSSGIGATMSWLRKPFGEEELFAAVNDAVGSSSRREDDGVQSRAKAGRESVSSHPDG